MGLLDEVEKEFEVLCEMRQQESTRSQQWRQAFIKSGVGESASPTTTPTSTGQERNMELEEKVKQLQSELERMKEKLSHHDGQQELPGMTTEHIANHQAELDYTKFAQFETAISDQMDVIEKLTEEKKGISVLYPGTLVFIQVLTPHHTHKDQNMFICICIYI
jgi:predicted RNase H-like nuclease (RuvC/YqgF family)